eukprot:TRINITY_DN18147_c0_g1_i2.p1 TRINITY_DN18147_c0_g1~~TRINITY_DN18147_c0_g1_i2.p1  ORF type:complete len:764 (+),score=98.45 TRINITY_DN18147_c0_g1_i2:228-2519(+)
MHAHEVRHKFTPPEDEALKRWVAEHPHMPPQGRRLWERAEHVGLTLHGWASMQNRWRKKLSKPSSAPAGRARCALPNSTGGSDGTSPGQQLHCPGEGRSAGDIGIWPSCGRQLELSSECKQLELDGTVFTSHRVWTDHGSEIKQPDGEDRMEEARDIEKVRCAQRAMPSASVQPPPPLLPRTPPPALPPMTSLPTLPPLPPPLPPPGLPLPSGSDCCCVVASLVDPQAAVAPQLCPETACSPVCSRSQRSSLRLQGPSGYRYRTASQERALELIQDDIPATWPKKRYRLTCKSSLQVLPIKSPSPLDARRKHSARIALLRARLARIRQLLRPKSKAREKNSNVQHTKATGEGHRTSTAVLQYGGFFPFTGKTINSPQHAASLHYIMLPGPGKYGNAQDQVLWDWYVNESRRELHPNAWKVSTALPLLRSARKGVAVEFESRGCVKGSLQKRRDFIVKLALGGAECRLYIPESQRDLFDLDVDRGVRLRPPLKEQAPFPVLMPSFGRSAIDSEPGFLDLRDTMQGQQGKAIRYVQIVAVKPSEVEKYRMSAPFFVVLELPRTPTVEHAIYGEARPEDLGVGCARHWLVKLADYLGAKHAFMLDDSVKQWKSVSFNANATPVLKRVPLSTVLSLLEKKAREMEVDGKPLSVLGFPRQGRFFNSNHRECQLKRAHVYSSVLLNVGRFFREQRLNYRQDIFLWEDIELNIRLVDVWQWNEIALYKHNFLSGGCSQMVAREPGNASFQREPQRGCVNRLRKRPRNIES